MAYLLYADITDKLATSFGETVVSSYFTEVDSEINDLAEQLGIESTTEIDTDYKESGRIHYKLIRFGVAFLCYRLFFDRGGVNSVETDPAVEKYYVKANMYMNLQSKLRSMITEEMFRDTVTSTSSRAAYSSIMVRS